MRRLQGQQRCLLVLEVWPQDGASTGQRLPLYRHHPDQDLDSHMQRSQWGREAPGLPCHTNSHVPALAAQSLSSHLQGPQLLLVLLPGLALPARGQGRALRAGKGQATGVWPQQVTQGGKRRV